MGILRQKSLVVENFSGVALKHKYDREVLDLPPDFREMYPENVAYSFERDLGHLGVAVYQEGDDREGVRKRALEARLTHFLRRQGWITSIKTKARVKGEFLMPSDDQEDENRAELERIQVLLGKAPQKDEAPAPKKRGRRKKTEESVAA